MRGFEFTCPLGLKAAILVRQQTRCSALPFTPIGEPGELLLQIGVHTPGARSRLLGQAQFFQAIEALNQSARALALVRQMSKRDLTAACVT